MKTASLIATTLATLFLLAAFLPLNVAPPPQQLDYLLFRLTKNVITKNMAGGHFSFSAAVSDYEQRKVESVDNFAKQIALGIAKLAKTLAEKQSKLVSEALKKLIVEELQEFKIYNAAVKQEFLEYLTEIGKEFHQNEALAIEQTKEMTQEAKTLLSCLLYFRLLYKNSWRISADAKGRARPNKAELVTQQWPAWWLQKVALLLERIVNCLFLHRTAPQLNAVVNAQLMEERGLLSREMLAMFERQV